MQFNLFDLVKALSEQQKDVCLIVAMTVLMPSWYYEKKDIKHSPSVLDGIDFERESRYRREGARFIINVGTKMGLRYDTMATGVVYFHRFYMFHSFKTFPRYVTACCCLFLAGKVEETPKKCKDIIRIAKTFLDDSQFAQFGDDPKEEVMTLERILLQTIKFDLRLDHPYGHLIRYAKCLKGDKLKLQNMVQMAWTFINDSLCTTLCLQFEPEVIAIAVMYLAGKLSKFEVVDWDDRTPLQKHWWDIFVEGMSIELLEDICHQVLDLYSTPISNHPQDSPPATPPTKSTRKISQPPSPAEVSTSPAQIKPKEVVVGQPIPRLEPGELKRKTLQPEIKKELLENKKRRPQEGKAIPIITSSSGSPKGNNSTQVSETQPPSPTTPIPLERISKPISKSTELPAQQCTTDVAFTTGISSINQQSFPQTVPILSTDISSKPIAISTIANVASVPTASFSPSIPPPTVTFSQSAPTFYSGVSIEKTFPNIQQPPPQIYPHQFQHPPPSGPPPPTGPPPPPTGPPPPGLPPSKFNDPPPQLPAMPPFNSQFPPPRHQRPPLPPNIPPPAPMPGITQHPPPPRPQGLPHVAGIRPVPPPNLPNVRPPRMMSDNRFGPRPPGTDVFNSRPPDFRPPGPDFGPRSRFDGDNQGFRGRKDSDSPFPHDRPFPEFDPGFHRPPQPNQFGHIFDRPPRPPMRFPLEPRRTPERGPRPPMGNNMSQPQGAPTGIPPVRITGSM
ncbi:cyclin-K [Caerostris darwini]|uniref:Cyclin-K n=1 Tax=Caerostris darwini TaxID=1538125 RepID=A0AAV4S5W8_9ARAC|nr:cyclin-K [Caerostris darwini]